MKPDKQPLDARAHLGDGDGARREMSSRRTYRAKLEFIFQVDDETLSEVKRLVQEHINVMYHEMYRDDIRIGLQTDFGVMDIDAVDDAALPSANDVLGILNRTDE